MDADRAAKKLIDRAGSAGAEWLQGYEENAAKGKQRAIAASGKHKQRTEEALKNGDYEKGVRAMNVEEAIQTAKEIGPAGYESSVKARAPKILRVMRIIAPQINAVSDNVQKMPQNTESEREQRMLHNLRGMRKVSKRGNRGAAA